MTKVLCIYVLSLSLLLCNMEARESRFFNKEPAYDNPNGGSNTAGYGEGYVTSSDRGVGDSFEADMGNGYRSYRGQGNGEGYVYGNSEASRAGSGSGAGYGEAGSGYPRSGSGKGAEYYSGNGVVNDDSGYGGGSGDDSGYRQSPGNTYAPYPPGSNGGYGEGGKYGSGYGERWEKSGAYGSRYSGGSYVTGSGNEKGYEAGSRYGAGSGNGNGEFGANNGYDKETP